jgi:integrative and conjugative element protein (TIGR02256 family)
MPRVWPVALTNETGDRLVIVGAGVVSQLETFLARDGGGLEAGGILLGLRRDPHLEIVEATLPSETDVRARYRFLRRSSTHQAAATRAWKSSRQVMDYVGEWHTHPEPHPSPSGVDRSELLRRSREHRGESLVELILGWEGVYVGMVWGGSYGGLRWLPFPT